MAYYPLSILPVQLDDDDGTLLSGGTIEAFLAGTTTPTNMFTDKDGTSAGDTITLNARGEPEVSGNAVTIWLNTSVSYKFVLKNAAGTTKYTIDDVSALDAGGVNYNRGDAGAVNRTVESRLKDFVSVKDFGAVGDAVADDTAAIQAAIDSLTNGGTVYFPPGTYIVTSTIAADDAVIHLVGAGIRSTTLQVNHTSGPAVQIKWYYSGISHMSIQGSAARLAASAGTNYGVFFPTDSSLAQSRFANYVRDCQISNHPSHGVYFTGQGWVLEDSRILDVGGHGVYIDNFDANTSYIAGYGEIKNTQMVRNTGHGVCGGINRAIFRVVLDNVDAFHCALNAGVRQSVRTIHIVGENIEIRSCAIAGFSGDSPSRTPAIGGVYINGRSPNIHNSRFIDLVTPAVELGANSDGARVIDNQVTGEAQGNLDPMVQVASGCTGVLVRQGFPTFADRLMTAAPANSGNRSYEYDISPQGYRSALQGITIADDAVHTFDFTGLVQGILVLSGNSSTTRGGIFQFRVGDGDAYVQHISTQTGVAGGTNAGAPTGTTGTDGNLTVYADTTANKLYLENRRGASMTYMPTWISLMNGELVL